MKKIHIVGILLIAISIGLLMSLSGEVATYSNFEDAINSGSRVKIAGTLMKDQEMYYEPEEDPNYFSFYLKDAKEQERKVILLAARPQDFELSEQIVLTGKMKGDDFVATEMLMKCPSKYKDEEIYIKSEKGEI